MLRRMYGTDCRFSDSSVRRQFSRLLSSEGLSR